MGAQASKVPRQMETVIMSSASDAVCLLGNISAVCLSKYSEKHRLEAMSRWLLFRNTNIKKKAKFDLSSMLLLCKRAGTAKEPKMPPVQYNVCENSVSYSCYYHIIQYLAEENSPRFVSTMRNLSFTLCAHFTKFLRRCCISIRRGGAWDNWTAAHPSPRSKMDYTGEA